MIDAATIGITLALQDGVSEGIATLRRDLSALDRAVEGAAGNLSRLGILAQGLQAGSLAQLTATASRAASATMPQPSAQPVAPASVDTAPMPAAPVPLVTPAAPAPTTARTPNAPVPAPDNAASAPIPFMPPTTAARPINAPPFAAFAPPLSAAPAPVTTSAALAPGPMSAPDFPASDFSTPRPSAAPMPAPTAAPALPSVDTLPANARVSSAPRAPRFSAAPPPGPAAQSLPDGAPATGAGSPRAAAAPEGRLLLEGFELGRWMSDRLDRAATRPPGGATGFDPRLSPAWPGPATGY